LAVAHDRPRGQLADGEDRRLRRVDHRGEVGDPVHPEVRDGERAAAQLGRRDGGGPHALGQRARLARDLAQPLRSASNTVGTTRLSWAATATPTLTRP
jgi:hypothetical protein